MSGGDPEPFATPRAAPEPRDDPFARAREGEVTTPGTPEPATFGPRAIRDPLAPPEVSGEFRVEGAVSFEDLLGRARRRGFVWGAAAGAAAAGAVALAVAWALAGPRAPPPPAAERRAAPAAPVEALAPPAPVPAPAPPAAARGADRTARAPRAPRAKVPAPPPEPAQAPPSAAPVEAAGEDAPRPDAGREDGAPREPAAAEPPAEAAAAEPPAGAVAAPGPGAARPGEADVRAALAALRDAIDGCFAAVAEDAEGARARGALLEVTIAPGGRVRDARLDAPELGSSALGACLVRVARQMSFPPFEGDAVRVVVPLPRAGGE